ncbi:hypothetical protein BDK51DRAFT_25928 [Blyttiomyces helicus]|uniref:Uncharacterized protein n=1 Tax=Blyttiomyces helicus TaxID=388810 RepID=A0A4P9VX82_9FUNG|nr:hypothetical protein BDK51DRAFT_25928 [Blyttiomyces helicus]|eukprot:RKO83842.1 hypothetical protein BDK51DRAFT_25928 [Blyttiomyces helicus]
MQGAGLGNEESLSRGQGPLTPRCPRVIQCVEEKADTPVWSNHRCWDVVPLRGLASMLEQCTVGRRKPHHGLAKLLDGLERFGGKNMIIVQFIHIVEPEWGVAAYQFQGTKQFFSFHLDRFFAEVIVVGDSLPMSGIHLVLQVFERTSDKTGGTGGVGICSTTVYVGGLNSSAHHPTNLPPPTPTEAAHQAP